SSALEAEAAKPIVRIAAHTRLGLFFRWPRDAFVMAPAPCQSRRIRSASARVGCRLPPAHGAFALGANRDRIDRHPALALDPLEVLAGRRRQIAPAPHGLGR